MGKEANSIGSEGKRRIEMSEYYINHSPSFDLKYEKTPDHYVVSDRSMAIAGIGESYLEALNDFRKSAEQYLEVLDSEPALDERLQWQREYLRKRLACQPISHT